MGSCLIYSNTVIAGLIIRQMYEMLRHPVPGALSIIMKKRTIATMTRGTKCYILLLLGYYIFDDYCTCSVTVKIYKNILGGLIPHISPKYGRD